MLRYTANIHASINDQETIHQHNAIDGGFTKRSPIRQTEIKNTIELIRVLFPSDDSTNHP